MVYTQHFCAKCGSDRVRRNGSKKDQTSIVEAINCSFRQRHRVLVRKSCSFNKSLAMPTAGIKMVIDTYNSTLR